MIVVESLINNVTYVVELSDVSTLSVSAAIAAKETSLQVLQQVNNQRAAIDLIQALLQSLRDQSEGFSVSAGQSASSALANKNATDVNLAQTLSALNSAVQIAMGQATGIAGILPTARFRANMTALPPEFSLTRAGTGATFFNRRGQLVTAQPNQPRFDFDPVTLDPLGILVESSATQFLTNSQTNSGFNGTVSTFLRNGETYFRFTPEPTIDNEKIAYSKSLSSGPATETGQRFVYFIAKPTQSTNHVFVSFGGIGGITFNFATKTFSAGSAQGISIVSSSFSETVDGFFHLRVTLNFTNAPTFFRIYANPITGADRRNCGLEYNYPLFSDVPSSPIINNTASPLTRPADNLTMLPANWNQEEWTVLIRVRVNENPLQIVFVAYDTLIANRIALSGSGGLSNFIDNTITNPSLVGGTSGLGNYDTFVFSYNRGRLAMSRNNALVQVMNVTQTFTVRNIDFIPYTNGARKHIHAFQYIPKALTDAQLQVRSNPLTFYGIGNDDVALNADLSDAAFTNISAIQRLPSRTDFPFPGTGAAAQRIFSLDFAATMQLVHLPSGGTYSVSAGTTVVPGTTVIPAGTNITVDFNVANNNILILAFLPAIQ